MYFRSSFCPYSSNISITRLEPAWQAAIKLLTSLTKEAGTLTFADTNSIHSLSKIPDVPILIPGKRMASSKQSWASGAIPLIEEPPTSIKWALVKVHPITSLFSWIGMTIPTSPWCRAPTVYGSLQIKMSPFSRSSGSRFFMISLTAILELAKWAST